MNPPAPQQSYSDLLSRGWQPLAPENYMLPVTEHDNPCNAPAPVISNVVLVQALATSARFTWTTDIPSTSQVIYTEVSSGIPGQTGQSSTYVTAHDVTATGLKPNTLYSVKVRSASTSGLSSESASFVFRSGR